MDGVVHFVDAFLNGLELLYDEIVLLVELGHLGEFGFLLDLVFQVVNVVVSIVESRGVVVVFGRV